MSEVVAAALRAGDRIVVTNADGEEKAIRSIVDYEQAYGDRKAVVQDDGLVLLVAPDGSSSLMEITRRVYPQRFADIGDVVSPDVIVSESKISFLVNNEVAIVLAYYPIKEGDKPRWQRLLTKTDVFTKHGYCHEFVQDVLTGVDIWAGKVNTRCAIASKHPEYFVGITEKEKDKAVRVIVDARPAEHYRPLKEEITRWFAECLSVDRCRTSAKTILQWLN